MTPYPFRTPAPMEHQRRALRFVIEHKGVAGLLMDPGTGKTRVVIDYLGMLTMKHGAQDWLVTAPLSALDTWPDQLRQWLPEGVAYEVVEPTGTVPEKAEQIANLPPNPGLLRLVLLSHDTFAQRQIVKGTKTVTAWDRLYAGLKTWGPDGLVVDESHRFKNPTAQRTKAMVNLARLTPKRLLLTGTVTPRNPLDIFGQWKVLNEGRFGTHFQRFKDTYALWGGWHNKEAVAWINQDRMRHLIKMDAIVVKKADALDLPPVTEVEVPVRLTQRERKAYDQMEREALAELPSGDAAMSPLAITKVLRLRQLTGGFVGYEDNTGRRRVEELGTTKAQVALEKVELLAEAGEKVVLFAHFRHDLEVLTRVIGKSRSLKGVPVYTVSGDTTAKKRLEYRQAFRDHDGPAVFVAQMRTMSLAVNELVVACNAIVFSMSERRDDFDQAIDRLDRQGQTRPVTVYHLLVRDSVDEVMLSAHRQKLTLETALIVWAKGRR